MIKIIVSFALTLLFLPAFAQQAKVYEQNQKWGLLGLDKKPITKAIYDEIIPGNQYHVVKKYDIAKARFFTGCVDGGGKVIIPLLYADLKIEGLRIIACQRSVDGFGYGIISFSNEVILPLQYRGIVPLGSLRFAVENKEGKSALFSDDGKQLSSFVFSDLSPFKKDFSIFKQEGLSGIIDRNGVVVVRPEYTSIEVGPDGIISGKKPNEWLWLTKTNQLERSLRADSIELIETTRYRIRKAGRYSLVDSSFALLFGPVDYITRKPLNDILLTMTLTHAATGTGFRARSSKMGAIHVSGKQLLPAVFDSTYVDSLFLYAKNSKGWLLYDHKGSLLSERGYTLFKKGNGVVYVQKNNFWGAVQKSGREQIACVYDSIFENSDQQFVVSFKGKIGIISSTENWLVAPQSHTLHLVNEERYIAKDGNLTILKDFNHKTLYFTNNELVIDDNYFIENTSFGERWQVTLNGLITKIQQRPSIEATIIREESEGYRAIKKDGKWGFIDSQGRLRIANRYDGVKSFTEGLGAFSILRKWGFLNHDDKIIIQPSYEDVTVFKNGISIVKQKGKYGLLQKNGKLVLPCRYDFIHLLPSGNFELVTNELHGLANKSGILQYEPKFNSQEESGDYMIIERGSKYGVVDVSGITIIPLIYDHIHHSPDNDQFLCMKRSELEILSGN
jgi:hypothetical protein